jgi:hypothetical protein
MSRSILARADALMHRRRQGSSEPDDVPVLVDAIDPDMDIPVLIDAEPQVAVVELPPEPEPAVDPEAGPALDDEMLDIIARELARRVHEHIAAELPAIVAATVRDFLAEPEILEQLRSRD